MSGPIDYAKLWVYSEDGKLRFQSLVAEGTIQIEGGGGGWVSVQKPLKHPVTVWRGPQEVYSMTIPLVLDVLDQDGYDVEGRCRTIERMCGQLTDDTDGQPPLLILDANGGIPNDVYNFPPLRWVIADPPVWGEQLRNGGGRRVRQLVTIKFMKYSAFDELTRNKNAQQSHPANTTIAKNGDTYNKVAARLLSRYGGLKLGNRLAQLNGAKDGAAKLLPGSVVKLPSQNDLKTWTNSPRR